PPQSVAGVAAAARDPEAGTAGSGSAEDDDGVGRAALTPVMRGFDLSGPGFARFRQSVVVRVPAGLGLERLRAAWRAVADRHGVLRSRLVEARPAGAQAEGWFLEIGPPGSWEAGPCVRRVDVSRLDAGDLSPVVAWAARDAERELDPAAGAMARLVWFDAGPSAPGRLLVMLHHLVVDGVSWRILLPDLRAAWEAVSAGQEPALAPAGTSFRRWTSLLEAEAASPGRLAELPDWEKTLEEPDPLLGSRPLDAGRDTLGSAASLSVTVPAGPAGALLGRLPSLYRCGAEDVLLAGLAMAFGQWRGNPLLVEVEGHGREEFAGADLSRTAGWFTSLRPVRLVLDGPGLGGTDPASALKRVKERLREMPDHGLGYGLLRHLNPDTAPRLAELGQPQVAFNYLGRFPAPGDGDWDVAAEMTAVTDTGGQSGLPLTHALTVTAVARDLPSGGTELELSFLWPPGVLAEAEVRALAGAWQRALDGLAAHAGHPGAGGRTPSDLPLLRLTQGEIDDLERETDVADILPLAPLQEGLLFHALYDDGAPDVYVVQLSLELAGRIDPGRLRAAAQALLARHPHLAARFVVRGSGQPVQVIPKASEVPWRELDLARAAEARAAEGTGAEEEALAAVAAEDRRRRFDLSRPPLLRFTLVRLGADRHVLVLTVHHILVDGWSMPVLVRELFALYGSGGDPSALPPATPFRAYLEWLAGRDRTASEAAWRGYLAGAEPCRLALAGDGDAAGDAGGTVRQLTRQLPAAAALRARTRELGVTLGSVVLGAWGVVLGGLTGRADV
ncbi:MAG: non-ribosomal peptide synthetase, partial [Nocardiopsaceae bacterium]|nr:non-ribosomal peptide synthetase [Nocardiopsaceae bacterium]